jgi:hypothetical protein
MLTTNRDCQRGGEHFAVPTLGEVEGKLIVSEVVATSCLRELLADPTSEPIPAIKQRITQTLQGRCKKAKLCGEDTEAAMEYAFQLLDAAVEVVRKHPQTKPRERETGRRLSVGAASR